MLLEGSEVIHGTVNSQLEVTVPITVKDFGGVDHDVVAALDTGFSGALILPNRFLASLGISAQLSSQLKLADGSVVPVGIHLTTIVWDGRIKQIRVEGFDTDSPLIGMKLL